MKDGAGEMAHMVAHSHLQGDAVPSSGVSEDSSGVLIYINK